MLTQLKSAAMALALSAALFTGCSGSDDDARPEEYKTYLIQEGGQFSGKSSDNMGQSLNTPAMRFAVIFDSTAIYKTKKPENQADINKLYGVTDCGSYSHHENSARFGWRWYKDRLEIHAYTYNNKERHEEFISTVELGKEYVYQISFRDNQYHFMLDGKTAILPRSCSGNGVGNKLYPYFGGDEKAPHAIRIKIKDL